MNAIKTDEFHFYTVAAIIVTVWITAIIVAGSFGLPLLAFILTVGLIVSPLVYSFWS